MKAYRLRWSSRTWPLPPNYARGNSLGNLPSILRWSRMTWSSMARFANGTSGEELSKQIGMALKDLADKGRVATIRSHANASFSRLLGFLVHTCINNGVTVF